MVDLLCLGLPKSHKYLFRYEQTSIFVVDMTKPSDFSFYVSVSVSFNSAQNWILS